MKNVMAKIPDLSQQLFNGRGYSLIFSWSDRT